MNLNSSKISFLDISSIIFLKVGSKPAWHHHYQKRSSSRHDDGHFCKLKKLTLIGWHILVLDIKMTPKYNEIHQAICEMQTSATTMKKVGANQLKKEITALE